MFRVLQTPTTIAEFEFGLDFVRPHMDRRFSILNSRFSIADRSLSRPITITVFWAPLFPVTLHKFCCAQPEEDSSPNWKCEEERINLLRLCKYLPGIEMWKWVGMEVYLEHIHRLLQGWTNINKIPLLFMFHGLFITYLNAADFRNAY